MSDRLQRFMRYLAALLHTLRTAEDGQGLVEYAAILGFVAACLVVAVLYLGPTVALTLNNVTNSI